jgi:uncharacterized damage-inducible protein DinB
MEHQLGPVEHLPYAADEKETVAAMLDQQRAAIAAICAGCSDEHLRARVVASDTTILGMVNHLAYVERWWFQEIFAGVDGEYPWSEDDWNAEFHVDDRATKDILDFYAVECDKSRAIVEEANLDDRASKRPEVSLRWICAHMALETARHAGQADILRELLDGATGLGHPPPRSV